eukprot:TRINITY_DN6711_c0_g1_i1.p1 TRINITY_DN6711_c0_g1~~TRINITY_DN6711_c0_g1_i1.p1  ORF type:complete len:359 (+),score=70.00 TRINITY_DN6711_c0_g1_i1:1-1077(+)
MTESMEDHSNDIHEKDTLTESKKPETVSSMKLNSEINSLRNLEDYQENQINILLEECKGIKEHIEEINASYKSILDSRPHNGCNTSTDTFSKEVETLRTITDNTIHTLQYDTAKEEKVAKNSPVIKKKHLMMKSPLTKRREIKTLLENHKDCETSDILQEIMNPWHEKPQKGPKANSNDNSSDNTTDTSSSDDIAITNTEEISDMRKRRIVVIDEFDDVQDNQDDSLDSVPVHCGVFPWKMTSFLLTLCTVGLVIADTNFHGAFRKSSIGCFVADTGLDSLTIWLLEGILTGKNLLLDILPIGNIVEAIHVATASLFGMAANFLSSPSVGEIMKVFEPVKLFAADLWKGIIQISNQYL